MPDDARPDRRGDPEMEKFQRSLAAMSEGLEGMMSAALHMQILVLEDAKQMMREMGAVVDSGASGSENGDNG